MPRKTSRSQPPAHAKRDSPARAWLKKKHPQFLDHQNNKTATQFFPRLYEEYFSMWPPIPTEDEISEAGGDVAIATATAREVEEYRIYRWMHNGTRSKDGVKGQGGSATLNLTTGPPRKKAALQAYVKYYWETKIKQAVIDLWAPTPETDLFRQIDNGEDQVAWEAMTPMEKNIPLWFRMEVGRKLYDAEPEEVKAEVDRLREQEKQTAITASTTTFETDEERLRVMRRFDENFPKLSNSLTNLCANMLRDFGFQTTIIVGGPIVRDSGRLSTFTFESPGTVHKKLTFSEFYGNSYETDVSHKFIEYLKLCFPRESRQHYTLDPAPDVAIVAPALPPAAPAIATPQRTTPTAQNLKTLSAPVAASTGPIRTTRTTRSSATRVNKRVPANAASLKNANTPQVEAPEVLSPQVNIPPVQTPLVNLSRPTTPPPGTPPQADAIPTEPNVPIITTEPTKPNAPIVTIDTTESGIPVIATTPPEVTLPAAEAFNDDNSDSMSYTSTLPDVFDVGMDDSAPPATGPWMIIDHFTGEMIIDDDQSTPPGPAEPSLAGVEVATTARLGVAYLVETPPTLLSEDEDVRPRWLMTAVRDFFRFVPYVGSLGKVIDLYLTQEARLGYPELSARLPLPSSNRPSEIAVFMKWGRDYSRGDNVDVKKFGPAVLQWWLTIQPTTRKNWPPVYDPLPDDFSFDYFNHGGPNGTFLMIMCLGWWANALTPDMDFADFNLIVSDVHWVLERIAAQA